MLFVNHLIILFTLAMFSTTAAIQDFKSQNDISQSIQIEQSRVQIGPYCKNHPRVLGAFERFEAALLESSLSAEEIDRVLGAALFAAKKHQSQTRKDAGATPYIIHPIGVAHYILAVSGDYTPEILIAALLHDTVEDTKTTFSELKATFGSEVEALVREVTDDRTLSRAKRKQLQIQHAHEKSPGAVKIKLADKLYNLADIHLNPPPSWSSKRCDEYFRWAEQVVANLPEASPELKAEVEKLIKAYWEKRGVSSTFDHQPRLESSHLPS